MTKWFIPSKENCDLTYSLEGLDANAKKVDLAVYGSNYCKLTDWNKGMPKIPSAADLKDTPLYVNPEQTAAPVRAQGTAIAEWKGKVTASTGALGKKTGAEDRVINQAGQSWGRPGLFASPGVAVGLENPRLVPTGFTLDNWSGRRSTRTDDPAS